MTPPTGQEVSPVDELGVGAVFLLREPERAADFADLAWVVAQALGDGVGVRRLEACVSGTGDLHVYVSASGPEYVRGVAARFGWQARDAGRPEWYLTTDGRIGQVLVSVSWVGPHPRDSRESDGAA